MPALPADGEINWGSKLNEFLRVSHREDGKLLGVYEVINVHDFGAKGNGIDDDTGFIQAAINEAQKQKFGATVYFPSGNYLLRSPEGNRAALSVTKSNIRLTGAGSSSILQNVTIAKDQQGNETGDGHAVIAISANPEITNIEIDHLTLKNAGETTTSDLAGLALIYITAGGQCHQLKFHDLELETRNRAAISFGTIVNGFWIYNNNVIGIGETGFYIAGKPSLGFICNNILRGVHPTTAIAPAISVRNSTDLLIAGNHIENYNHSGIVLRDELSNRVQIVDNRIYNLPAGAVGIYIHSACNVTVAGNIIDQIPLDVKEKYPTNGILVHSSNVKYPTQNITIRGNKILNGGGYAIKAEKSIDATTPQNIVIENNEIIECQSGIQVDRLNGANRIYGNYVTHDVAGSFAPLDIQSLGSGKLLVAENLLHNVGAISGTPTEARNNTIW